MGVKLRLAFSDGKTLPFDQDPKGIDELRSLWPSDLGGFLEVNNLLTYDSCSRDFSRALDINDAKQAQGLLSGVQGTFCTNGEVISFVAPDNKMYVTGHTDKAERLLMMSSYQRGRLNIPLNLNHVAIARITPENEQLPKKPDVDLIVRGAEALKNFDQIRRNFISPESKQPVAVAEAVRVAFKWFP